MDDFCTMVQTTNKEELLHVSRSLLHVIHSVFSPQEVSGVRGGRSHILQKITRRWWETGCAQRNIRMSI